MLNFKIDYNIISFAGRRSVNISIYQNPFNLFFKDFFIIMRRIIKIILGRHKAAPPYGPPNTFFLPAAFTFPNDIPVHGSCFRREIEKDKYIIKIFISIDKLKKLVFNYRDKSIKYINKAGLNAKKDQPLD